MELCCWLNTSRALHKSPSDDVNDACNRANDNAKPRVAATTTITTTGGWRGGWGFEGGGGCEGDGDGRCDRRDGRRGLEHSGDWHANSRELAVDVVGRQTSFNLIRGLDAGCPNCKVDACVLRKETSARRTAACRRAAFSTAACRRAAFSTAACRRAAFALPLPAALRCQRGSHPHLLSSQGDQDSVPQPHPGVPRCTRVPIPPGWIPRRLQGISVMWQTCFPATCALELYGESP